MNNQNDTPVSEFSMDLPTEIIIDVQCEEIDQNDFNFIKPVRVRKYSRWQKGLEKIKIGLKSKRAKEIFSLAKIGFLAGISISMAFRIFQPQPAYAQEIPNNANEYYEYQYYPYGDNTNLPIPARKISLWNKTVKLFNSLDTYVLLPLDKLVVKLTLILAKGLVYTTSFYCGVYVGDKLSSIMYNVSIGTYYRIKSYLQCYWHL